MSDEAGRVRTLFTLLAVFAAVALFSLGFPPRARIYPLFVGVMGVILGLGELVSGRRRGSAGAPDPSPSQPGASSQSRSTFRAVGPYLLWLAAYLAGAALVGFVLASGGFVAIFLHKEGRVAAVRSSLAGLGVVLFLILAGMALGLHWPPAVVDPLVAWGVI